MQFLAHKELNLILLEGWVIKNHFVLVLMALVVVWVEKAQELLTQEWYELMDKQGIIHGITNCNDLDEAPSAYKDIDVVIANEKDLVESIVELRPLAVIKRTVMNIIKQKMETKCRQLYIYRLTNDPILLAFS